MRIGIYGGTFNPIHNTHVDIAKTAKEKYQLDIVYFLVAGTPPHKDTAENIADSCRLDMVKLAIEDIQGFAVDQREILRAGKSYSYITLQEYALEYPDDELFFIMGSDSIINFTKWVHPEIISGNASIIAAPRKGDDITAVNKAISECNDLYDGSFELLDYSANAVASTVIRKDFYTNQKVRADLDQKVAEYIVEHHLYSSYKYDYKKVMELSEAMEKELKPSRYIHTIGVANTAFNMATKWNYPAFNAMVAGMLHDSAKCISDEKRLSICHKNDIPITDIENKYPHLLHGKVGAYFCKSKYDVFDEQIAHAIEVHTTGCPNMNLLDKIIFVADYIEPGRDKQPRLDILRKMAFEDLDMCVFMILQDSVNYLNENPDMVDPTTIDTYNYYLNIIKRREVNNGI
ncbi:MAG: nicotinate (nicotinamide) nucleotide adenylyltransferase [Pseudobutyrivibrio sp.]|nr:nicotinate (nicotinamide) nucleotide adenylyltransferase [Pseudobutyrivibrio sp.]